MLSVVLVRFTSERVYTSGQYYQSRRFYISILFPYLSTHNFYCSGICDPILYCARYRYLAVRYLNFVLEIPSYQRHIDSGTLGLVPELRKHTQIPVTQAQQGVLGTDSLWVLSLSLSRTLYWYSMCTQDLAVAYTLPVQHVYYRIYRYTYR